MRGVGRLGVGRWLMTWARMRWDGNGRSNEVGTWNDEGVREFSQPGWIQTLCYDHCPSEMSTKIFVNSHYSRDHPPVENGTVQYDNLFCNQSGSYGLAGLLAKSRVHCTMCTFFSIFFHATEQAQTYLKNWVFVSPLTYICPSVREVHVSTFL